MFKLVVGLGNPGRKYENNRHNIGFKVIDKFCRNNEIQLSYTGFKGIYYKGKIFDKNVIILKPMTYMNLSGVAVSSLVSMYKIPNQNILIIYDDMDLPFGKIRIRVKGSAGGHNGMKSIIEYLGNTIDIPRIRVGIGRNNDGGSVNHVLSNFFKEEENILEKVINKSCEAIEHIIKYEDLARVMNEYNQNECI